jgi:hypothetical protein
VGHDETCNGKPNEGCVCDGLNVPAEIPPDSAYDLTTAGIVLDKVTGLAWQRDSLGALGSPAQSAAACSAKGADWRLPTVTELFSLVNHAVVPGSGTPTINAVAFPATTAIPFWTSQASTANWYVNFRAGDIDGKIYDVPASAFEARCVRRAQSVRCYPQGARFSVGTTEITDGQTGLVWAKAISTNVTFATAKSSCATQGARVPEIKELATILDYGKLGNSSVAKIDAAFGSTPADTFWSSTAVGSDNWILYFNTNDVGRAPVSGGTSDVRCVR